jgi:hypothetical protein
MLDLYHRPFYCPDPGDEGVCNYQTYGPVKPILPQLAKFASD